jgi:hypothetical protein
MCAYYTHIHTHVHIHTHIDIWRLVWCGVVGAGCVSGLVSALTWLSSPVGASGGWCGVVASGLVSALTYFFFLIWCEVSQ